MFTTKLHQILFKISYFKTHFTVRQRRAEFKYENLDALLNKKKFKNYAINH